MRERRRFTSEFKRQAVPLPNPGTRLAAEITRKLGIPWNRLHKRQKTVAEHDAFHGSDRQAEPTASDFTEVSAT